MGYQILQKLSGEAWALTRRQHGVIARWQLLELGFHPQAIKHRMAKGRLHPVYRGVYAVGRPELTPEGHWMAAVLACGPQAFLSHQSAALLWRILREHHGRRAPTYPIHISLNAAVFRQLPGIQVHRTATLTAADLTTHRDIPVTSPIRTLLDLATILPPDKLEAAVNEADVLGLTDPESLRGAIESRKGQPGVRPLRTLLDRHTFRLTESELERRFLRLVRRAGLPVPDTQAQLGGRVDFHWPAFGLVVETDGLRYHRTPARQANDNRRMQAHAAAGRTAIRVSHYEIRFQSARVEAVLADLIRRRLAA